MTGLTRRQFMATTGTLAVAYGISTESLVNAVAATNPAAPGNGNTLAGTIKAGPEVNKKFRHLLPAPGEPHMLRWDLLKSEPKKVATERRSLFYLGHLSDIHIIDAQSPGRLEPLVAISASFVDATRPQELMTVPVLTGMVESIRGSIRSTVTGAPMDLLLNTGDAADSMNSLELRWYIDTLDGGTIRPNSGGEEYEGVQAWGNSYAYQPNDPMVNSYGEYGFPKLPELLQKAISLEVESPGLPVPWYTMYGNHDTTFMGNMNPSNSMRQWAMGGQKDNSPASSVGLLANGFGTDMTALGRAYQAIENVIGRSAGVKQVTSDPRREMFNQKIFMEEHLNSPAVPGPIGHGFTQEHVETGQTYWRIDPTDYMMILGLDSCNQVSGADGAIPEDQFNWIIRQLDSVKGQNKLVIVASHHNSHTLENPSSPAIGPDQPLIHSAQFVEKLLEYPEVIAWVNGHTHINSIFAHARGEEGGFWEITTASCIDFPQQQQVVEVVDNRDGTLSIFCTTMDHDAPAEWQENDYSQSGLRSLSRTLAANMWEVNPPVHPGSLLDRNVELRLPAPFDMSKVSESTVEKVHMAAEARLTSAGL